MDWNLLSRVYPESTVAICNNGDTAIVVDDHCYLIRNWNGRNWGVSRWIFAEALVELKKLPDNPDDAEVLVFDNLEGEI